MDCGGAASSSLRAHLLCIGKQRKKLSGDRELSLVFNIARVTFAAGTEEALMLEFLPEDIRRGLEAAQSRAARKGSRLCVHVGDAVYPIAKLWDEGFSVEAGRVPALRGLVDIYDGPRHLSRALIIAASEEGARMIYEFKRETPVTDRPIRDYADEGFTPSGYLAKQA
jgi:hypothetical protein